MHGQSRPSETPPQHLCSACHNRECRNPVRARVTAGPRVRFFNNGGDAAHHRGAGRKLEHRHAAPALMGYVTFDEPGTFPYHYTDHSWRSGEITVEER